jgi:hypothetical protein
MDDRVRYRRRKGGKDEMEYKQKEVMNVRREIELN